MSTHEHALATHEPAGTTRLFVWVWVALMLATGIEVFLTYERLALLIMLVALMGLSCIKSAFILSYFMHLRFERLGLFLMIIPVLVFVICLILIFFFPDSVRLYQMHTH
jgi:cytochrome c oxidase subunit IV